MAEEEVFQTHMKNNGITEATITILAEQDFVNRDSLSVMEIGDIASLKLKQLTQKRLVVRLLKRGHGDGIKAGDIETAQAQDKSSDVITDNNAAAKVTSEMATTQLLNNLLQTVTRATPEPETPGRVTQHAVTSHDRGELNPIVYLAENDKAQYLDIVDFVPRRTEETLLSSWSGIELSLKMGPKRPNLENVTMMEWTAANAKIMVKLLLEGKLSSPNSAQYLAYTVKIASLAQRYMWQSIILYDREYRRAPATYNVQLSVRQ